MTHRTRRAVCGLLLFCATAHLAGAAVFKVGSDAACTHHRLADAIAAAEQNGPGMDEIRLPLNHGQGTQTGKYFIIDQSLRIVGGYKFCSSTSQSGFRTQLNGTIGHFAIASQPTRRSFVELVNLELQSGNGALVGGSLEIYGRAEVTLNNSVLHDNWGETGGAIYLDGMKFADPARLNLIASEVSRNLASYNGGGIDCRGGAQVVLKRGSSVRDNEARRGNGGGVALDACRWWQGGGTSVSDNTATDGGGIFAASGSTLFATWVVDRGSPAAPTVDGNKATNYAGSGIALTGAGTYLDARGLHLVGNYKFGGTGVSYAEGVALYAEDGAAAWLHRDDLCKAGSAACSRIARNVASVDAGFASIVLAETGASIVVAQTEVSDNIASVDSLASGGTAALFSANDGKRQSRITLRNSVVSGNDAGTLFLRHYPDERAFSVVLSTLKDNRAGTLFDSYYRNQPFAIDMAASVIDETAPLALVPLATDSTFDCMLTRTAPGLAATRSLVAAPLLGADGAPLSGSPAIDFCSGEALPLFEADVLGQPRPLNVWDVFDRYGPVDAGAFETVPPTLVIGP